MFEIVSPQEAARMIDGFMLGAVMQQDPFLEQFGTLPEEPPDEDPCWDAVPTEGEVGTNTDTPTVAPPPPSQRLEQGSLFGDEKKVAGPTNPSTQMGRPKPRAVREERHSPQIPIYEPHHIPYADFLKMFNGIASLAMYWFEKQKIKE